jgi:hypothetical protein
MTYLQGSSPVPYDYDCALYWSLSSTSPTYTCADCEWAFEIALDYDESGSTDPGGCGGGDTFYAFGYDADYYGSYEILWYYYSYGAQWVPLWYAYDDGTAVSFSSGYIDQLSLTYDPYGYGVYYYMTNSWFGTLYVQ